MSTQSPHAWASARTHYKPPGETFTTLYLEASLTDTGTKTARVNQTLRIPRELISFGRFSCLVGFPGTERESL